ncbi:trimeric intracellular cation channel family protein [Brevibacterium jeotgali]|nr:trimeric intracellular cation channel family protein [Brevibacterium jeotgali]
MEPLMFSLDLLGVLAFAVSGNLLAARKNIDIMGSLVLGLCAGLGGGIMRDVILGRVPSSLQEPIYLLPPVVTALTVYLLGQRALHARVPIVAFDALGLGVFATTGTAIAMGAGLPLASAILLGVLTAVGGGMIRDVLANEIPAVFNGSDLYIIPAIVGAGLTALLWAVGWFEPWAALVIAVPVFVVRMLAWYFEWRVPTPMRGWSYSSVRGVLPRTLSVFRRPPERDRGVFAPRRSRTAGPDEPEENGRA